MMTTLTTYITAYMQKFQKIAVLTKTEMHDYKEFLKNGHVMFSAKFVKKDKQGYKKSLFVVESVSINEEKLIKRIKKTLNI